METADLLTLLQDVAAEVVTPRFRHLDADQVSEKNPGDLVTVADREAEKLITEALLSAHPDAVVLGEETYADDPALMGRFAAASHSFTLDPVDGTKNFVHGSPDHAVMVAELMDGAVVRAVIWQPQHELAWTAERGAGAFRNGERVTCAASSSEPAQWHVRTSRRRWIGRELEGMAPLELTWLSCGVDYPHLAAGDADALLYRAAKPWDHAPGSLIVTEAGGHVGLTDGSAYDPRTEPTIGLVAAADRSVHDAVVARLRSTDW